MTDTYWRCKRCGHVYMSDLACLPCEAELGDKDMEPVVVLPVAELEALRALKARVEDEAIATKALALGKKSIAAAIEDYRAALRGEG